MKDCYECQLKTVRKLLAKRSVSSLLYDEIISDTQNIISNNAERVAPWIAAAIHRNIKTKLQTEDLYLFEKQESNTLILNDYEYWKQYVDKSENSIFMAALLAVIGNIIDYGAHSVPENLILKIKELLNQSLRIDHRVQLQHAINNAKSIVYLGDNSGEIVLDKLFIETMQHNNVTYVVRDKPVLNDVTINDANFVGMKNVANIISNGFDAPSTILSASSKQFINVYNNADLIISKGQGNFEGLYTEKDPRIFFMLIAKCNIMAELLRVNLGDIIIMKQNILNRF